MKNGEGYGNRVRYEGKDEGYECEKAWATREIHETGACEGFEQIKKKVTVDSHDWIGFVKHEFICSH